MKVVETITFKEGDILSIREISLYVDCTPANIGYHIKEKHLKVIKEGSKLCEYTGNNITVIENMKLKKSGY